MFESKNVNIVVEEVIERDSIFQSKIVYIVVEDVIDL
jgi:hypothetical protein